MWNGNEEFVAREDKVIVLDAATERLWPRLIFEADRRRHKPTTGRNLMSAQESIPHKTDLLAIDRVREAHIAALNPGNVDAFVGVFSEDAVQMPPNAPANVGRAMIRAWIIAFLDLFRVEFALEVAEVRVAGDWAFERGAYRIGLSPKAGGEAIQDVGKYITIYQKQADGAWLTARDIWNSNSPPPGMQ